MDRHGYGYRLRRDVDQPKLCSCHIPLLAKRGCAKCSINGNVSKSMCWNYFTQLNRLHTHFRLYVRFGVWRFHESDSTHSYRVSQIVVNNPLYDLNFHIDIGLAKLATNVQYSGKHTRN